MTEGSFADLWRKAGPNYRVGLLIILVGLLSFVPSGIAIGILMSNQSPGTFGWISLVCYGIGVFLIILGNLMRIRAIKVYRAQLH